MIKLQDSMIQSQYSMIQSQVSMIQSYDSILRFNYQILGFNDSIQDSMIQSQDSMIQAQDSILGCMILVYFIRVSQPFYTLLTNLQYDYITILQLILPAGNVLLLAFNFGSVNPTKQIKMHIFCRLEHSVNTKLFDSLLSYSNLLNK